MNKAFIFPGQGSQFVGMGKDLAQSFNCVKHLFEQINDTIKQNLSKLMFEGPMEELTLTENAQVALMACSLAIITVLEQQGKLSLASHIKFVAGHSLGEYSALAAAKALTVSDTAALLKTRGQAMQSSVSHGQGAMAALLGADLEQAQMIIDKSKHFGVCELANDNCPGQVVLSGDAEAIDYAINIATNEFGKKAVKLAVSAPFHCSLMKPAQIIMQEALKGVQMISPLVPIVTNITANTETSPEKLKQLLVEQVTGMVRWRETIMYLKDQNVDTIIEIGAGKVLSGLNKRIDKDITAISIQTPSDIDNYINQQLIND